MKVHVDSIVHFFKALADATRLKITRYLFNGARTQGDIKKEINRSQSTVSSHIERLVSTGIVLVDEESHPSRYSVHPVVKTLFEEVAEFVFTRFKKKIDAEIVSNLALELIDPNTSLEKISKLVVEHSKDLTSSEHGYVGVIDPESKDLLILPTVDHVFLGKEMPADMKLRFSPNEDGTYAAPWGRSLNIREAYFTNKPILNDLPLDNHVKINNFLSVPVEYAGNLVGQIFVANSYFGYDDGDIASIEKIANLYGAAILPRIDQVLNH